MSYQEKQLRQIKTVIQKIYHKERDLRGRKKASLFPCFFLWRWVMMLYHEFVRNEVKVRAESLSYLMGFSILPLIAGAFFIFNIFSQFGMVQEVLQNLLDKTLTTIPLEHQEFLLEYVNKFKESYLRSMTGKSSSIGIFALFFLFWVGLQMFKNIDRTLNYIWSAEKVRPFLEDMRNFLVVSVTAPIGIIAGLSLPLIFSKLPITAELFRRLPLLATLFNLILPITLLLVIFTLMYQFIPVRKVRFKAAIFGSLFATVFLQFSNILVQYYFKYGTNTAYGKAASIPIVAFWMYLAWIIIIMGAELSFLIQNEKALLGSVESERSIKEGQALLGVLSTLRNAFIGGKNPVPFEDLIAVSGLNSTRLHDMMAFLESRNYAVESTSMKGAKEVHDIDGLFVLARTLDDISIGVILDEFFLSAAAMPGFPFEKEWKQGVDRWLAGFDSVKAGAFFDRASHESG